MFNIIRSAREINMLNIIRSAREINMLNLIRSAREILVPIGQVTSECSDNSGETM